MGCANTMTKQVLSFKCPLIHISRKTSFFILGITVLFACYAEARWCTRTVSETTVRSIIVMSKCNQSYQDECGWFTSNTCTYYEITDCPITVNKTFVRYKIVEECCKGFVLDPANNITCIHDLGGTSEDDATSETPKPSDSQSLIGNKEDTGKNANISEVKNQTWGSTDLTPSVVSMNNSVGKVTSEPVLVNNNSFSRKGHVNVSSYDGGDGLLWGLSYGAYAGIICSLLFVICVLVLIGLHLRKRQRNNRMKANTEKEDLEMSKKMIQSPQA